MSSQRSLRRPAATDLERDGRSPDLEVPAYNYEKSAAPAPQFRPIANPAPLGLCGFALTTFVLSLINVGAGGVSVPNIVIGIGLAAV
jgi:succinate-acetate transporter protein